MPNDNATTNTAAQDAPKKKRGRPTEVESMMKRSRAEQADFLIGCSLDERADAVRLVRLLRSNYWLANFARQVLRLEADHPSQVPIEKVQRQLDNIATIEDLVGRVQFIGRQRNNYFQSHPAVRAVVEEWGDEIFQYKSDQDIRELIESAKKVVKP